MSGYDQAQDAVGGLSSALTADGLVLNVDDISGASRGIAEVDLEVMRVRQVDPQNNSLLLYPFGRGYRGSVATTHAPGTEVRFNPTWLAATVAREINGVLDEIYPTVYGVQSEEFSFQSAGTGTALPIDDYAVGVISVWVNDGSTKDEWIRDDHWDYNPDSSTVGKGLRMSTAYRAGRLGRVVYAVKPQKFDLGGALDQDFQAVTGLPERCADLLTLGVAYRMAPYIDVGRLSFLSASAREDGTNRRSGDASTVARLLASIFKARLDAEALVLAREHPIRVHATR